MTIPVYLDMTDMEPDARAVLHEVARRLRRGLATYGELHISEDGRDWDKEAEEEALDWLVYRSIARIARERHEARERG